MHVSVLSHATIILLPSWFPLPQLKTLYETLRTHIQIISDDGQLASARLFVL